ncbi:MAG TPA: asparagine synthase (glutamine-hydrolyzing) [Chitinophagaceae bacterium]
MCGIAGIVSATPGRFSVADVESMAQCLAHRGPDGSASWQNADGTAILAHKRLAILDLTPSADQPMHLAERYTIVHNGEIYNFKELRNSLSSNGYSFRSQSDTEVILAAYDYWKENCLQHFEGMFAFAIWDEKERSLFAARDRFGEKPFYFYCDHNAKLLHFASELKSFYSAGFSKRDINSNLLLHYLANGVSFTADAFQTFHRDIMKLPARHYLRFSPFSDEGLLEIEPYYDIDKLNRIRINPEEAVAQFTGLFRQSVQRGLRSDVGLGASLSGGIDSASVVATACGLQQDGIQNAFTASFPGFEKDETAAAAKIATRFGLRHHAVTIGDNTFASELESFLRRHDEPVSSSSVYAQYKVYEQAGREGVKVLLDGQGADELLAGYSRYYPWYLQELFAGKQKQQLGKELAESDYPFGLKNKMAAYFPGWAAIRLERKAFQQQKRMQDLHPSFLEANLSRETVYKPVVRTLNDILYSDVFGGRLEELLRNADRNAMAHGVEVRLPFLNHRLAEFIFSLPATYKIRNGNTKYILRQAMDKILPPEINWNRTKTGFEPPQQTWMQHPKVQEQVFEAKTRLVQEKILSPAALERPVLPQAAHEAGNYDWRYLSAAALFS